MRANDFSGTAPGDPSPTPYFGIDHVALRVRDLGNADSFYRRTLGLGEIESDADVVRLGVAGRTLIELRGNPDLSPHTPDQAGLFHTAFRLPSRGDLGRWLAYSRDIDLDLTGTADHWVNEAVYFSDPEGNGIEIYCDRDASAWCYDERGHVMIDTGCLDTQGLAEAAGSRHWMGAPGGMDIGHVHLQVGNLDTARPFFTDRLGLAQTSARPGGDFYGHDGYHHHLAANTWQSAGAAARSTTLTGLDEVRLAVDAQRFDEMQARLDGRGDIANVQDPWGTCFSVMRQPETP